VSAEALPFRAAVVATEREGEGFRGDQRGGGGEGPPVRRGSVVVLAQIYDGTLRVFFPAGVIVLIFRCHIDGPYRV